ncbi:MAG: penicillin-binding protein activator [Gammaproteobacteria bacterium]
MQVVLQRLTGLCLLAMLIAVGLSACGVAPTRPSAPALENATVKAAQALEQKGDRQGAARVYLQAAQKAPSPQALEYRLRAADLLIEDGALDKADTVLAGLPPKTSEPTTTLRLQLLRARLALAEHRPQDALQALQSAPTEGQVPTEYNNRYYELRAQAFAMAGNHLESARERVWLPAFRQRLAATERRPP